MNRDLHRRALALALGLAIASSNAPVRAETAQQRGDRAFAERASGFPARGAPDPEPIAAAVAAYEEALAGEPESLPLLLKLMDALYFQGYYVVGEKKAQRRIYERLLELAWRAFDLLAARAGGADELARLSPEERAEALRGVPEAAAVYYWLTASWGLWGMTHHPLNAVRRGVASKVRDHAQMLVLLDDTFVDGAGLRMLGRLHTDAPKVPLVTGWIDRREGLALLRRAVAVSRRDPRNLLFLAEAILAHDEPRRAEALELLRELARRRPDPESLVEDSESLERARRLLAELEGGP